MRAGFGVREEFQEIVEVPKLEATQDQPLRLNPRSDRKPMLWVVKRERLIFAERQTAEALVEARDLAARIKQLLVAAGPGRMHLRIDVEVQRVAFLAPGRSGLELGAVGHFDVDHVVIGVSAGFMLFFLGLAAGFRPAATS